jgi:endonuclease-3
MKGRGGPRQPLSVKRPGANAARKAAVKAAESGARPRKGATRDAVVAAARTGRKRESAAARRARALEVYALLEREHPDAHCELDHRNPYELLVATILSAQCTDKRVNLTTPALFAEYPDAAALASARQERLEELVKSTGFFRNKAKSLLGMSAAVVERHGGAIPDEMDALVQLPGVGRKTANVVLGNAFGRNEGVVVDTHVARVAGRLGLTAESDPVKIERDLAALFPREWWTMLSHLLIFHGRRICDARAPKCERCPLTALCPSSRI